MSVNSSIPTSTSVRGFRGRIDSDFNRNLAHLGLSGGEESGRRDSAEDRAAARKIITGLLLQGVGEQRIKSIRLGLCRAIAAGDDQQRADVRGFGESLTQWYDSISDDALASESKAATIIAEFDAQLAALESFARQYRK